MKLQTKIILLVSALFFLTIAVVYFLMELFFLDSFTKIEKESLKQKVKQAQSIFFQEFDLLKSVAYDYAVWEETYLFLEGENSKFVENHITNAMFSNLGLNLVALVDEDRHLIAAKAYDLVSEKEIAVPAGFINHIDKSDCPLLTFEEESKGKASIMLFPEGAMVVASHPVLKNDGSGPLAGFLIVGRLIDKNFIDKMRDITRLDLAIEVVGDLTDAKTSGINQEPAEEKIMILNLSDQEMIGFFIVSDIHNQPAIKLSVSAKRDIYLHGLAAIQYAMILLIVSSLVISFFIYLFFEIVVINRIQSLLHWINGIFKGKIKFKKYEIKNKDELADLANAFNSLLEKVEKANLVLEENSKRIKEKMIAAQRDKEEIDKQRQAILNILEDVSASEEEYKALSRELGKKSAELASLKSLSDDFTGLLSVNEAIKVLNKYIEKFANLAAALYFVFDPADERNFYFKAYLGKEASEPFIRELKNKMLSFSESGGSPVMKKAVKIIKNVNPQIFRRKLNNNASEEESHDFFYPLAIGETYFGAVLLSCADEKSLRENENLISAMITSFTFFISHLYSLFSTYHLQTASLVKSLSDGIIMFNKERKIVLVNPAFINYTGLTIKDFGLEDFYVSFKDINIAAMVEKALTLGEPSLINELEINRRCYEVFVTPVKESEKKVVGGAIIMHDITHTKEISRLKTEFVSVASHQLRTPLTAVKLFTEMLLQEEVGKLKNKQREYLLNIGQSIERMVRLVNDLLNITRIESGRLRVSPELTDLIDFISKIIEEVEPVAEEKKVHIIFQKSKNQLPKVMLDRNLIRQVVHNLLVNGIKYSPAGQGEVIISVRQDKNGDFLFSVADNGIGIPEQVQKRIFEKFFRADNAVKVVTEGTGLGLYVSKMIVESSGGKIWFKSVEGKGTTFYFTLPAKGMEKKEGERGLIIS